MTIVHLNIGGGITACAVRIPDLWPDHRWWTPEHGGESPVNCEWCLRRRAAPLCMLNPDALKRVQMPRYGPNGEIVLRSDRDPIRADFARRLDEGKVGPVEATALACWDGAEVEVARLTKALQTTQAENRALRIRVDATWSAEYAEIDRLRARLARALRAAARGAEAHDLRTLSYRGRVWSRKLAP